MDARGCSLGRNGDVVVACWRVVDRCERVVSELAEDVVGASAEFAGDPSLVVAGASATSTRASDARRASRMGWFGLQIAGFRTSIGLTQYTLKRVRGWGPDGDDAAPSGAPARVRAIAAALGTR